MMDIEDRIVEAILGQELTRKLDDYIAQEVVRDLHGRRFTRLEVLKSGVEVVIGFAQMALDQRKVDQKRANEIRALFAAGKSWKDVQAELHCSRSTIAKYLNRVA